MSAAVAHAAPTGAAPARPHAAAPAAAGARPRAGGGLRICVPLRLVVGAQYRDAALRTYIKIAALSLRPQGCRAKVSTLAGWLNTSASEIERGLRDLQNPDPVDGITEVITTRKTMRDGTGESAHRTVRPLDTDAGGELFVWIPVRAADVLRPRLLRLYGAIAYAQARRMPLTVRELADHLRHESGDHQGETLTARQTARLLEELAATGWITVHHRQGPRGRHAYEANPSPLHAVPAPAAATVVVVPAAPARTRVPAVTADVCPDIRDGSAPGSPDGSPCEEDRPTDRPEHTAPPTAVSGSAVRRLQPVAGGPVDTVDNPGAALRAAGGRGTSGAYSGGPADGSGPTLSARAWAVLAPVRHLIGPDTTRWEITRIEREILAQLARGTGMERLQRRLARRYSSTFEVRDGARWILGRGLPHNVGIGNAGTTCNIPECEDGVIVTAYDTHECHACPRPDTPAPATPPARTDGGEQRPVPVPEQRPTPAEERPPAPAEVVSDGWQWPTREQPPAPDGHPDPWAMPRLSLQETATPAAVRAAIQTYGRGAAVHLYGLRLVGPQLNHLDGYTSGGEADAQ